MSQHRMRFVMSLLVVLGLGIALLPDLPLPLVVPTAHAATSPLEFMWAAQTAQPTNSVAWGDVDGDGDLDLAVGNYNQPNQLYRNQGGTLVLDTAWNPGARATTSVAWGDLDNDGDLDLAVGNYGQANQLYRNQGGTLVLEASWLPVARATQSVAWGDVDGDGYLDLIVGNNDQRNQLYRNQGGTLILDTTWLPVAQPTQSVAWGDVDGDGDLDLAVGNNRQANQLYRNQSGTLVLDTTWGPGAQPTQSVAWGDVDGDGDLDFAVGNAFQASQLYRNQGGTLVLDAAWNPSPGETYSLAWGDADGDGDLDLVLTGLRNEIYWNQGGTLTRDPNWVPRVGGTRSVAWGDVDGDGNLDLATGNYNQVTLIYRNQVRALAVDADAWNTPIQSTQSVAWGDVDGDGDLDLAVGNDGQPNQIYRNQGGTLILDTTWNPGTQPTRSMAWGDVDGDGDLDLVVGNFNAANQLYRNQSGTLGLDATWTPNAQLTLSLAWGDVDGDGDLDLVVGNYGQPNQLYRNQGGTLVLDATWAPATRLTRSVVWGDVDGDGDLDLAVGNKGQPNQLYRNQGGTLVLDPAWTPDAQPTMSLAWGDVDGDGDLDLAIGNFEASNQLYLNQDGALVLDSRWHPEPSITENLMWGDVDGDGALDLTVAGVESKLYRNEGGTLVLDPWALPGTGTLAWGDVDGDGDLDLTAGWTTKSSQLYRNGTSGAQRLPANPPTVATRPPDEAGASANFYALARILASSQFTLPFTLADPEGDPVDKVAAQYSLNGGGSWHAALAAQGTTTTNLATLAERFPASLAAPLAMPDPGSFTSTVTIAPPTNGTVGSITAVEVELTLTHPAVGELSADLIAPDGTVVSLFAGVGGNGANMTGLILDDAAATSLTTGTAPFTGRFRPAGSLATFVGKSPVGQWSLRVTDGTLGNTGTLVAWTLRMQTTGVQHQFVWDTFTSGVFGQSDNVVVRLVAYPALTTGRNGVPFFQRPTATATTFPFRVRGTQVRVVNAQNEPQTDALVFRLNPTLAREQQLFAPSTTAPAYTTNPLGYLPGRGELTPGDALIALAPLSLPGPYANVYSPTVRLYATNIVPTSAGVSGTPVVSSGVQTVTVGLTHPLALFDLSIALEWDARYDARFMAQIQTDLARASELLFQSSHGQAALGNLTLYHDRENWDSADIRIYASNRVRPSALIGGVAGVDLTDPASSQVVYGPGQVRMGAIWNRFGSANGNLSEDWPRTLVHELSHYLFFLEDNYLGLKAGQIVPVSSCPGLMSDTYAAVWQYQTSAGWSPGCDLTFSQQTTGRADWSTIQTFYPALIAPTQPLSTLNAGPLRLPLALTEIASVDPLTPTERLAVPIFYTVDSAGERVLPALTARAYLFQHSHGPASADYTQVLPLGRATNDQVVARGARVGDRLCLFEPTATRFGCTTIQAGNEQLRLTSQPLWQPDLQVTPITSVTLEVAVTGVPAGASGFRAALYPLDDDPLPTPITLSPMADGSYQGRFTLVNPLQGAYVHVQTTDGPTPTWETVTSFALSGNAGGFARMGGGFARMGGAPVASAEGDVLLLGDNLSFDLGQFLLLQTTSSLPSLPAWATLVGHGYRFTTSPNAPDLTGSALSFSYLDAEVPAGEETGIQVYYRNSTATAWTPITTTLDTHFNLASIPNQGPGLYALLSSVHVALTSAGWNNFSYPVASSRAVGLALGSISGQYGIVYSHVPTDTLDPWKVYAPAPAPSWVSDLTELHFGQGYWIYATQAADLLLRSGTATITGGMALANTLGAPPALVYGVLSTVGGVPPPVGAVVEARIGATVCGQGVTQQVGTHVGLVVKVAAAEPVAFACGAPGREVTVMVNSNVVGRVWWNNTRAVNLADTVLVYLPFLRR